MTNSKYFAIMIAIGLTLPAFAGGGGGGGRGGRGGGGGGFGIGGGAGGFGQGGQGQQQGFGGGQGGFQQGGGGGRTGGGQNPGGFQGGQQGGGGGQQGGQGGFGGGRGGRNQQLQMNGDFSVLDTTSIFSRDRRSVDFNAETVVERPVIIDKGSIPVFRGSMKDDKGYSAMLETLQNGNVTTFKVQEGGTIPWNNAKVLEITADSMTIANPSVGDNQGETVKVSIGNNIQNDPAQASSVGGVGYVSADVLAAQQQQQQQQGGFGGGRGGRGGRGQGGQGGFGGGQGGFGGGQGGQGGFGGGQGGFGGGQGVGTIGITGGQGTTNTVNSAGIVNPSLDPPIPPGSADSLEARMAARRAAQVGG